MRSDAIFSAPGHAPEIWRTLQVKFQAAPQLPADMPFDEVALGLIPGAATLCLKLTEINDDPFPDGHVQALESLVPLNPYIHILNTDVTFHSGGIVGLIDSVTGPITDCVRALTKEGIRGRCSEGQLAICYSQVCRRSARSRGLARLGQGAREQHRGTVLDPGMVLVGIGVEVLPVHARVDIGLITGHIDDPDVLPPAELSGFRIPIREREIYVHVADHPHASA